MQLPKKTTLKLNANLIKDALEESAKDAVLLAINSTLKDYQFCSQVNHHLGVQFCLRNEPAYTARPAGLSTTIEYPMYTYEEPLGFATHEIIYNYVNGVYLMKESTHIDFLWLVRYSNNEDIDEIGKQLLQTVKQMPFVLLVALLPWSKCNNLKQLLL